MREIKGKVLELERVMYAERHCSSRNEKGGDGCPHICLSRYSPYPGTGICRSPLSDKYIPWEVMHIDYEPPTYSKSKYEFPQSMQAYVDEDIIILKEMKTRNTGIKVKYPKYKWNSFQLNENGDNINRISWQLNSDGSALHYKIEDKFIPLNPLGRTGLRGRGGLPRWGPNHYVMFVISRWQRSQSSNTRNLEIVVEESDNDIGLLEVIR